MVSLYPKLSALKLVSAGTALIVGAVACGTPAAPSTGAPQQPAIQAPAATATTEPPAAAATAATTPASSAAAIPVPGGYTGVGLIKAAMEGEGKALTGAGATFPAPLYTKWFSEYEKATGVKVNYQPIGSGGGIKGITDATMDFAGTDAFMTTEQLKAAEGKGVVLHIPASLGAVVPTYNIPGVTKQLKFTPDTLASIFLGEITKWNDPKLMADNPDAALPNTDIVTVHRSDGSGTTSIWVDYLSTVNKKWETTVGRGTSVKWPNGLGASGNAGVTGEIKNNPNSIGYVELIYAIQNKLASGQVKNKAGKFIEPNLESVTAAAAGVAANVPADLRVSIVDATGDTTYPISGFTWLLAYDKMTDAPKASAITRMLWWSVYDGQAFNKDLGYAPLPASIQAKAAQKVLDIKLDGKQAFPGK